MKGACDVYKKLLEDLWNFFLWAKSRKESLIVCYEGRVERGR